MKGNLWISFVVLSVAAPALYASQLPSRSTSYWQGTVVEVQKHKVYSPDYMMGGSNPSDAPLTSRYYAFEVAVRVACNTYVGRYETEFNYLPSAFTPNQPIRVRLTKHVMYFDLPNDPDMRMGIVRHSLDCAQNR
ncbi:MAG: hypothetical protein WAL32_09900 [Terriglobales bacterium]